MENTRRSRESSALYFPSKSAMIKFKHSDSLQSFVELYNNLHFPFHRTAPPCIVMPLGTIEFIEAAEPVLYPTTTSLPSLLTNRWKIITIGSCDLPSPSPSVSSTSMSPSSHISASTTNESSGSRSSGGLNKRALIEAWYGGELPHIEVEEQGDGGPSTSLSRAGGALLPPCVVCLRRIRVEVTGIEGGDDVPVSSSFTGYGER